MGRGSESSVCYGVHGVASSASTFSSLLASGRSLAGDAECVDGTVLCGPPIAISLRHDWKQQTGRTGSLFAPFRFASAGAGGAGEQWISARNRRASGKEVTNPAA